MKFKNNRVAVNSTIYEKMKLVTLNPKSKTAVTSSIEQILYFNKLNYKNMTLTVCKEFLFTFQYGIYLRKNSFLEAPFNQKIRNLKSSGLIDFWASDYIRQEYMNIKIHDDSPKKLNIDQLMGGFEVWFIGVATGFMFFALEIVAVSLHFPKIQKAIEFFT